MERIALISDIHGNLPALEAVLSHIEAKGINRIICLGDMIGKGPSSPQVVDICREKCTEVVIGNWDKYVSNNEKEGAVNWYRSQLGEERLAYLRDLPEYIGFYISGKYMRLLHAHCHDVFKRVSRSSTEEEKMELFELPKLKGQDVEKEHPTDIVGYGDIHGAYMEGVGGRLLFNVGSVGNPCDHIPMASYVIIEGVIDSRDEQDISIGFQRVAYDKERAIKDAEAIDLPNSHIYVNEIRTAVYGRK